MDGTNCSPYRSKVSIRRISTTASRQKPRLSRRFHPVDQSRGAQLSINDPQAGYGRWMAPIVFP